MIKFGTDGVREVANSELTPEMAFKLGRFGGYVLAQNIEEDSRRILVGRDTRISGRMLEYALVAGLLSIGAEVFRLGVISTPKRKTSAPIDNNPATNAYSNIRPLILVSLPTKIRES